MIFWWICINVKSEDLIRLLIGQFDLIMGPIKGLIKFKINLVKLKDLVKCKDLIKLLMGQVNFIRDLIVEKLNFKT